jgi:hypothetical protein
MRFIARLIWTPRSIQKVSSHNLTMADVEEGIDTAYDETASRNSGLPMRFGYAIDGRHIGIVFRWETATTVSIVTAYEVPEP